MDKTYQPQNFEQEIYRQWEEGGFFHAEVDDSRKRFSISMPPPNATGVLHTGHAMFVTISDIVVRYKRMQGYNTLWLPGTDHAAIATQTKVEKIIAKEGLTRFDLGREKFLERVRDYVENSRSTIQSQLRAAGASCDWQREAYTFSDRLSNAVNVAFKKLFDDGLIYRGNRIVNWCPRCHSTLADDELDYRPEKTILYTFKYDKEFPVAISTTRPETKLGDTAVAVNPDDERYQDLIGQELTVSFCGQPLSIKIIADPGVEKGFGTGALGVTPAHSYVDFEMAQTNNLPVIKVIDEDGKMMTNTGEFAGQTVTEAREKVINCLRESGLLENEEEIEHNLSVCYRCGTPVEPLTSEQWFVDVNKKIGGWQVGKINGLEEGKKYSIKDVSRMVVLNSQIKIYPHNFEKIYFDWMDNLRDWCISRQIWWGHRIPVFYRKPELKDQDSGLKSKEDVYVGTEVPRDGDWIQDEDTLDTWFSSALWTFSTLGWPEETPDLKYFHPTDLMETGRDIIFQWVARMIIMSTYLLGEIPFKDVYFHGMMQDKQGRKMSKSLDNAVDPMEMINEYGADAMRLSLVTGLAPGIDVRYYPEKVLGQRNFVNKLWNVARFIIGSLDSGFLGTKIDIRDIREMELSLDDRWILSRLDGLIKQTTDHLDNYRFSLASEGMVNFVWHELADWYIEMVKADLSEQAEEKRRVNVQKVLSFILMKVLRLLHPYTPFVTEAIWSELSQDDWGKLIVAPWPKEIGYADEKIDQQIAVIVEAISGVRKMLADYQMVNVKDQTIQVVFKMDDLDKKLTLDMMERLIKNVTQVEVVDVLSEGLAVGTFKGLDAGIVIDQQMLNREHELLEKEIENVTGYIEGLKRKLDDVGFVSRAPEAVVEKEKGKLEEAEKKLADLQERLKN